MKTASMMETRWKVISALLGALLLAAVVLYYLGLDDRPSLLANYGRLQPGISLAEVETLIGPSTGSSDVHPPQDGPDVVEIRLWGHHRQSGEIRVAFDAEGRLLWKTYSPPYGLYDRLSTR